MQIRLLGAMCLALCLSALLTGCAPSRLENARRMLAAAQYGNARAELLRMQHQATALKPAERRELMDDLCLADFMIGHPTLSLGEQRRACVRALQWPGSRSGPLLGSIDKALRDSQRQAVEAALGEGDLPGAQEAAIRYERMPGSDPARLRSWTREIWNLVEKNDQDASVRRSRHLRSTLSRLRIKYREVRRMDEKAFRHWVSDQIGLSAGPGGFRLAFSSARLDLWMNRERLRESRFILDRFARINDAVSLRCGCEGRTNVGVLESGFPAYLVRLDPDTRASEVIILPQESPSSRGRASIGKAGSPSILRPGELPDHSHTMLSPL